MIAKYLRLERAAQAEEHYQAALKVMAPKPYVDVPSIASMIEFIAESDPLVAKVKPEMVINHTILKNSTTTVFSSSCRGNNGDCSQ